MEKAETPATRSGAEAGHIQLQYLRARVHRRNPAFSRAARRRTFCDSREGHQGAIESRAGRALRCVSSWLVAPLRQRTTLTPPAAIQPLSVRRRPDVRTGRSFLSSGRRSPTKSPTPTADFPRPSREGAAAQRTATSHSLHIVSLAIRSARGTATARLSVPRSARHAQAACTP